MMLWDIIRDWFVQYIWGGYDSLGNVFICHIGEWSIVTNDGEDYLLSSTADFKVPVFNGLFGDWLQGGVVSYVDGQWFIGLGDWLSTTSTIIVLVSLCVFLAFCVRYLFKFLGGLFKW